MSAQPPLSALLRQVPRNALLKSTQRAFIYSYLYIVLPRVVKKITRAIEKRQDPRDTLAGLLRTLVRGLHPLKFALLMARMFATMNVLAPFLARAQQANSCPRKLRGRRLPDLVACFLAAMINFPSFQSHIIKYNRFFSLDMTLILFTRALDTVVSSYFGGKVAPLGFLLHYGDGLLFVVSSFLIMHNWFFYPDKLPPAYQRWITSAADVDQEIMHGFRSLKDGTLKYGDPNCPNADAFKPLCTKYGKDPELASLVKHQPFSCEILHVFTTKSCELHALWRFQKGFRFAFKLYGTINLIVWLIRRGNPKRLIFNTIRSSAFLGTFIGLYWYSLCLARNRVLPFLFPKTPVTRWDDTFAPAAGAMGCGFGCFVENEQRRKELSLFVAPRALGTLVSSEPTKRNLLIERLVFSLSFMTLVAVAKQDHKKVRGIMGKGLGQILRN
jgi:hypothetical protein